LIFLIKLLYYIRFVKNIVNKSFNYCLVKLFPRLTNDRENKRIKNSLETSKQREARLARNRVQKQWERQRKVLDYADERLNRQDEQLTDNFQPLSESDRKLLGKFCTEMNKLEHKICSMRNERFPLVTLVLGCVVAVTVIKMR